MSLQEIIKQARIKKGLTQEDVAVKLGYTSTQFVSLFERGKSKVPHGTIGKLIVVLGLPQKKLEKLLINEFRENLIKSISIGISEAKK